jgi:hypothetical protein
MRFEVLTTITMKVSIHQSNLMMEAVSTSETLVNFYQATCCNYPEDSHLE